MSIAQEILDTTGGLTWFEWGRLSSEQRAYYYGKFFHDKFIVPHSLPEDKLDCVYCNHNDLVNN